MQTPPHPSEISHPAGSQLLPSHHPFTLCSQLVLSELRPPIRETAPRLPLDPCHPVWGERRGLVSRQSLPFTILPCY